MQVRLTEKAAFRLRTFLRSGAEANPNRGVRLAVTDGGCSGYQYSLDIANSPKIDDLIVEEDKVLFYVDRQSAPLLEGVLIDFVESLAQSGFKFSNPNATETCGCGTSFKAGECSPAGTPCS